MNNEKVDFKYLNFLSMLYVTIMLITCVMIYKIVDIGFAFASASTLIIPFWYFLSDIITEVYGYNISRNLIWSAIFCQFVFAALCVGLISLKSPISYVGQGAYIQVLGDSLRVAVSSFIAVFLGAFTNIYVLSKWKILLKGRYFWLRCLWSSAVGEAIFTVVAFTLEFYSKVSSHQLLQLILISYCIKLSIAPVAIFPISIITSILKKLENISHAETFNGSYNPFIFKQAK